MKPLHTPEVGTHEYMRQMRSRFCPIITEDREESVIKIANYILEELHDASECEVILALGHYRISDAYISMEAAVCMLKERGVYVAYTIDIGKRSEEDEEEHYDSLCKYDADVNIYAFKDTASKNKNI
jgi:hypothetical protein